MGIVTVVFLFVLYMINYVDKSIAGYSAEQITEQMQLDPAQWGMVGSSFYWLFAIAGVIGAGLSDRIGTKKVLLIMAVIWTVVQLGAYAITSLPLLIVARMLLGAGEGPTWPVIVSHISKWFPEEKRGFIFALLTFGASVGASLFTPLLVRSIETAGWQTTWAILGSLSLVWFILWLFIGAERPGSGLPEREAAVPAVPAETKWSDVFATVLSANFACSFFIYFAQIWGVTFVLVWMPTYLVKVFHFTSAEMSSAVAVIGVVSGVITLATCILADYLFRKTKRHRKSYVRVGGIAVTAGGVLFSLIPWVQSPSMLIAIFCAGLGLTVSAGSLVSVIGSTLLPARTGLIMGIMSGLVTIAGIVSPIVTGAIVKSAADDIALGFNQALLLNSGLYLVSGVLFYLLVKRKERDASLSGEGLAKAN
ncbi:MFS transporter [Brevibacillus borstelensis]|uniref:MFS transporter n=1 Tax=Brevibacillus borstelensis TaxID=45462 RepID=UPI0030BB915F